VIKMHDLLEVTMQVMNERKQVYKAGDSITRYGINGKVLKTGSKDGTVLVRFSGKAGVFLSKHDAVDNRLEKAAVVSVGGVIGTILDTSGYGYYLVEVEPQDLWVEPETFTYMGADITDDLNIGDIVDYYHIEGTVANIEGDSITVDFDDDVYLDYYELDAAEIDALAKGSHVMHRNVEGTVISFNANTETVHVKFKDSLSVDVEDVEKIS
jgi:hypothetical protein